ncbi:uncharacterized protein I303_104450 [Kwoniella dejecticola CBS 10117]|uniref:Kinesin n=1 Tax=Kwoniella dejecticola CBS 10117 TaxID=1296121 RepID=A0A1A6A5B1_9TREE|nr:kinesin [Kwoniella dejecticola CBS 10117]OBR85238.1 kinesin [Kwoniella dejecticola CBS 10117]
MDANAIQIAVRCRPWHPTKELPFITQPSNQPYFYGDGNMGTSSAKPAAPGALRNVVEVIDNRELDFDKPQDPNEGRRGAPMAGRRYKNRKYVFDQVFSMEASQEDVFSRTAKPLLPGVLDGYNATVFAYGATGCGKTHTISGTEEQPGIIVRTMKELFDLVEDTKLKFDTYFQMSMVEIYNETIRDLLSDDYPACPPGGLKLLENEKERVKVANVTNKTPTSVEEVMALVMQGNERRSTSFTARNSTSSRSHLVLQINVVRNERGSDVDVAKSTVRQTSTSATLSIIDLAGSEKASVNRGQRMKEGANINKSLLALSGCISALCAPPVRGIRQHVPYRDSKLTRLLKFSLGGNCRTVMINCISPSSKDIEETNNTLLWADKAKKVSTKVSRNTAGVELRTAQWIQKIVTLEATIKSLESQLAAGHNASSGMQQRRLMKARSDAQEELRRVQTELDDLLPVVLEGSEMEALWNASILQVEALDTRLADIELEVQSGRSSDDAQKEKSQIRRLIQQQDVAYRFNSQIQSGIQNKSLKHITLSNLLKKAEERGFDEDLKEAKYEHRLEILKHHLHITKSVSAAKERGLRDYIAQQADMATKSASLLARFAILLQKEVSALSAESDLNAVISRLGSLMSTVDNSVATLFGESSEPLLSSSTSARLPVSLAAPSPRRPSARQSISSSPKRFNKKVSPKKRGPLRPSLFGSAGVEKEKKGLRWRDEAGEGKIDDRSIAPDCPVFSSPSTNNEASTGNISTPSSSSSPESENVQTKTARLPIAASSSFSSKPVSPLIPAPLRSLNNNSVPTSITSCPPPLPVPNEEIPAWKQMRLARGVAMSQPIEIISEESPSKSPIGLGRPSAPGLMGPPARPGPLGELQQNPSASASSTGPGPRPSSSLSHSTSMSNLLRPTAASAAKAAASASVLGNGGASTSIFANVKIPLNSLTSNSSGSGSTDGHGSSMSLPSRRVSMIGPARHDRPRQRMSMLPPSLSSHPSSSSDASLSGMGMMKGFSGNGNSGGTNGHGNTSVLSGGARRIGGPRSSILPTSASGLPRGPRPSISTSTTEGSKPVWR